jgi:heat shock protein HslJ
LRFAALCLVLLAGCSDNAVVAGQRLVLDSEEGVPALAGAKLRLRFSDDGLAVWAGCNTIGASYHVRHGVLSVGSYGTTEMLCEPAVDVEEAFQAFLLKSPSIEVLPSRAVVLKHGSQRLVFVDQELGLKTPGQLAGRALVLGSQVGAPELVDVPLGLTFTGNDLSASGGCSRVTGKYRVAEGALVVDDLSRFTPIDCECAEADTWFELFLRQKPAIEFLASGALVLKRTSARLVFVNQKQL